MLKKISCKITNNTNTTLGLEDKNYEDENLPRDSDPDYR